MNDFYERCADLLGTSYDCQPFPWPDYKRTRWNNRAPGGGRFEGFGVIRKFGSQVQVALRHPITHHKIYQSEQEVIDFLIDLKEGLL